jgi:hypothetical protein
MTEIHANMLRPGDRFQFANPQRAVTRDGEPVTGFAVRPHPCLADNYLRGHCVDTLTPLMWVEEGTYELYAFTNTDRVIFQEDSHWAEDLLAQNIVPENLRRLLRGDREKQLFQEDSHWADDPDWPASDWRAEVANGDTRLGYSAWVEGQRSATG